MSGTHPVVIIGGGIGGLAAALALLDAGIDVEVYERTPELREVGAGVQIAANASRVLRRLGIADELVASSSESIGKEIRLWNTGDAWPVPDTGGESESRFGAPFLTLYRPDLLDALARAVRARKPDAIRLGAGCNRVRLDGDRVLAEFDDGRTLSAQCLVGADGIHSAVRESLFGPSDPKFTGCLAWRGVVPAARLPARFLRHISANWIGPGHHVVTYPLRRGQFLNFVGIVGGTTWNVESWTERGTAEQCLADFEGWHDDVRQIIGTLEQPYRWALRGRKAMPTWHAGAAVLLGDACHPTLPFLGQGAGMAIEDAAVLARCLAKYGKDLATAFSRYEAERIPRTTRIVDQSAAMLGVFQGRVLSNAAEAQAYVEREWAPEKVRGRYDWLYTYDSYAVPV